MSILELVDRIAEAPGADALWRLSRDVFADHGASGLIWMDAGDARAVRFLETSSDQSWSSHYAGTVRRARDPFMDYCLSTLEPIPTGPAYLDRYPRLRPMDREMIEWAGAAFGVGCGVSCTVRQSRGLGSGGAGWNLLSDIPAGEFEKHWNAHWDEIRLSAHLLHGALAGAAESSACGEDILSPRERDCLTLISKGRRVTEIAWQLSLAEGTVELHLRNARRKLEARTRDEAVARALVLGAICP